MAAGGGRGEHNRHRVDVAHVEGDGGDVVHCLEQFKVVLVVDPSVDVVCLFSIFELWFVEQRGNV